MNPELRQTLNTISRNLESANEVAQENIYTFTQLVIDPCLEGFKACLNDCTASVFPKREERLRRQRARSRGRSDLHFDFYDDWEDEETGTFGPGTWANDELDSLLAGRGSKSGQPGRQRGMSYGTRNRRPTHPSGEENPNIIPSSSYLGFLERFKWRPGARGLRYKPSAADLQEHPGTTALERDESEPLMEDSDEDAHLASRIKKHKRQRSDTEASRSTTNSLSSRGDLIMGDEEDDAQPLDDEFAVMLTRQTTSGSRRPGVSRKSTRVASNKSSTSVQTRRSNSSKSLHPIPDSPVTERTNIEPPTMDTLKAEEEHLRQEQEMEIAQKREAATQLAKRRGMDSDTIVSTESLETKSPEPEPEPEPADSTEPTQTLRPPDRSRTPVKSSSNEIEQRLGLASPMSSIAGYNADSETEPFPSLPTSPLRETREFDHPP